MPRSTGIDSKWVFKTELTPVRYKARLVVKGYHQIKDVDFTETYAPVSRLASFRMLLAFASQHGWRIDHMDVTIAFLHPQIGQQNVLMNTPEPNGLDDLSEFGIHSLQTTVRLRKALYGLKQAPRL